MSLKTSMKKALTVFSDVAEFVLRIVFLLPRGAKAVDADVLYRDDPVSYKNPADVHREFSKKLRDDHEDRRRRGWSRN